MNDPEVTKRLGLFIGRKREQRGLSQTALAKAAGISRPYLAQIEGGNRFPSDEVVTRLLAQLGMPMEEFIRDVIGKTLENQQQVEAAVSITSSLEQLAANMSPEQLLTFMGQMQSFEQIAANLQTLSPLDATPIPTGPDGWMRLKSEDRRLVQRLVNRLLDSYPQGASNGDL